METHLSQTKAVYFLIMKSIFNNNTKKNFKTPSPKKANLINVSLENKKFWYPLHMYL